jgi:hypothetical protein
MSPVSSGRREIGTVRGRDARPPGDSTSVRGAVYRYWAEMIQLMDIVCAMEDPAAVEFDPSTGMRPESDSA